MHAHTHYTLAAVQTLCVCLKVCNTKYIHNNPLQLHFDLCPHTHMNNHTHTPTPTVTHTRTPTHTTTVMRVNTLRSFLSFIFVHFFHSIFLNVSPLRELYDMTWSIRYIPIYTVIYRYNPFPHTDLIFLLTICHFTLFPLPLFSLSLYPLWLLLLLLLLSVLLLSFFFDVIYLLYLLLLCV